MYYYFLILNLYISCIDYTKIDIPLQNILIKNCLLRWLEEAILNLDPSDPVTREHMGTVLMTLQNQLAAFAASNPNHRSTRRMKMLGMATRALLSQHP